jgi:Fe-Mn family superoxide dismutase
MIQHTLPRLPYPKTALEPYISAETLDFHHGKHHAAYIDKLNSLIAGTEFATAPLEEIVTRASGAIFDNAAQAWNHAFYWNCLSPNGGGVPEGALAEAIDREFSGYAEFRNLFTEAAENKFGSGWTWLVKTRNGSLAIINTDDAGNPMTDSGFPLLTCDIWEHAYYIDYRNARQQYIEAFWNIANWEFASRNYSASSGGELVTDAAANSRHSSNRQR